MTLDDVDGGASASQSARASVGDAAGCRKGWRQRRLHFDGFWETLVRCALVYGAAAPPAVPVAEKVKALLLFLYKNRIGREADGVKHERADSSKYLRSDLIIRADKFTKRFKQVWARDGYRALDGALRLTRNEAFKEGFPQYDVGLEVGGDAGAAFTLKAASAKKLLAFVKRADLLARQRQLAHLHPKAVLGDRARPVARCTPWL